MKNRFKVVSLAALAIIAMAGSGLRAQQAEEEGGCVYFYSSVTCHGNAGQMCNDYGAQFCQGNPPTSGGNGTCGSCGPEGCIGAPNGEKWILSCCGGCMGSGS